MCALSPRLRHVLHPIRALPPSHSALCPSVLLPPQSDSCQHALGHVMSVLPHHPRKPAYSTRPNPILDAASSSPQGYLASSPPVPARCRNIPTDYQGYPGGYASTLRDAHVSHNSIPGPQGVQSSGETAPVMGRSSHHHARIAIDSEAARGQFSGSERSTHMFSQSLPLQAACISSLA